MSIFAYLFGWMPERRKCSIVGVSLLALALPIAGCASRAPVHVRAPVYQPEPYARDNWPSRVAGYRHQQNQRRVEVEDDGMESQTPPPMVRKREPDDPSEPFSPNYGRFTTLKRADAGGAAVHIPNDLPEEFRHKLEKSASGT